MPRSSAPWETQREVFVKALDRTSMEYGRRPEERAAQEILKYGVVNLDKPAGPSSHEVAAWTKRIFKVEAVGHGGTLDPNVTGVLPITLMESRKIVQALLVSGKEYVCVMKLHGGVQEKRVERVLKEFEDEIFQRPPLRSSVKRQLRKRRIYYLDLLETEGRNVLFKVGCEGGTYIRKLCYDVGEVLGCGAHMQELRRTRAGPFVEENSVRLHDIAYALSQFQGSGDEAVLREFVQPVENALALVPKVWIRDSAVDAVCHGADLTAPGVLSFESGIKRGSVFAVFSLKNEVVALCRAESDSTEIQNLEHGVVGKTERVIMPRGTYPKCWKSGEKSDDSGKRQA